MAVSIARAIFLAMAFLTLFSYFILSFYQTTEPKILRPLLFIGILSVGTTIFCHVVYEAWCSSEVRWRRHLQTRSVLSDDSLDQEAARKYGLNTGETAVASKVRRIVFDGISITPEKIRFDDKVPSLVLSEVDCSDVVTELESAFAVNLSPLELDEPTLDDLVKWVLNAIREKSQLSQSQIRGKSPTGE
jgi:hypothetical protein